MVPSFYSHFERLETDEKPSWRGRSHVNKSLTHCFGGPIRIWGCRKEYEVGYAFSSLAARITLIRGGIPVLFLYRSENMLTFFSLMWLPV